MEQCVLGIEAVFWKDKPPADAPAVLRGDGVAGPPRVGGPGDRDPDRAGPGQVRKIRSVNRQVGELNRTCVRLPAGAAIDVNRSNRP